MCGTDRLKEFRIQLLDFIDHNLEVGYINNKMTVEEFKKFVDVCLGGYIDTIDKVNTSILRSE